MPESKSKSAAAKDDSKAPQKTAENEEARIPDEPELRGQSLQDHDRIQAEHDPNGNPVRSEPDRAPADRDEALDEVRRVRAENEERTRRHSTVAIEREVHATGPGNGNDRPISVATRDSRLYINTHGEKVLTRDQVVDLQHALAAAFQAVS